MAFLWQLIRVYMLYQKGNYSFLKFNHLRMNTSIWLLYFLIWCGISTYISFLMKRRIIQFILEEKAVVCALISSTPMYQGNAKIWYNKRAHSCRFVVSQIKSIIAGQKRNMYYGQLPETRNFRKSGNPQVFWGIVLKRLYLVFLAAQSTIKHPGPLLNFCLQRPGWF